MAVGAQFISTHFIWRRVHSLMGLWLVIFLTEHLVVNSQAALWLDDGHKFVQLVNLLESLPFLHAIEIVFIGVPLLLHGYWGVKRALTAKSNEFKSDGSVPSLPFGRSRAFTWQRLTSWILLFGILGHVIQMRFIQMPQEIQIGNETHYVVRLTEDPSLSPLAARFNVTLAKEGTHMTATANSPGKVILLMVRETFKNPWMCGLYMVFVLAAAFHAWNGFWTSLITWGVILSYRSQKALIPICWIGAAFLAFLGFAAIWGS